MKMKIDTSKKTRQSAIQHLSTNKLCRKVDQTSEERIKIASKHYLNPMVLSSPWIAGLRSEGKPWGMMVLRLNPELEKDEQNDSKTLLKLPNGLIIEPNELENVDCNAIMTECNSEKKLLAVEMKFPCP